MTAHAQTIAVVGSSPLAWLLAGLLAADHSRAIVLVSTPPDPHRLRPTASFSLSPVTRPHTLARLSEASGPDAKRIDRIAPGLLRRINMSLFARTEPSRHALSHMRHAMAGFGHVVEPVRFAPISEFRVRNIWQFQPAIFEKAAARWLSSLNVAIVNSGTGLKLDKDGSARFGATRVDRVVLADDAAIRDRLTAKEMAGFAAIEPHIGICTAPAAAAPESVRIDLDTGAVLTHTPLGQWQGHAPDVDGKGLDRLAACLPGGAKARLAAQTRFDLLVTHDNAPVIGPTRQRGVFVIVGLGMADIALAPMLARLIAEKGTPAERQWAEAHAPSLRQPRQDVADFAPFRVTEPAREMA